MHLSTKKETNISVITYNSLPYRKDVRLPVQLQRAMAAEAEAAREARAKVSNRINSLLLHVPT